MNSKKEKNVTWNFLADVFERETGGKARTRPMDSIFDWALSRPDLFKQSPDDGLIYIGKP